MTSRSDWELCWGLLRNYRTKIARLIRPGETGAYNKEKSPSLSPGPKNPEKIGFFREMPKNRAFWAVKCVKTYANVYKRRNITAQMRYDRPVIASNGRKSARYVTPWGQKTQLRSP